MNERQDAASPATVRFTRAEQDTVGVAVMGACDHIFLGDGTSCISGFVGQGISGVGIVTWGFQSGFYTFIASTILLIGTLALQTNKARYS